MIYEEPPTPKSVRFNVEDDNVDEDEGEGDSSDNHYPRGSRHRSPPPPSTPSPTRSGSTVSSAGIQTPPSPGFSILTEAKYPSPSPDFAANPKLHPALCSLTSALKWDMAEDPSELPALAMDGNDPAASIHSRYRLSQMILKNEWLPDWPLHISAPPGEPYLTVMQVLTALRQHLLKLVGGEYFKEQPVERRKQISEAYRLRLKCWPDSERGTMRLDYLPGRTFEGLSVMGARESDMQWEVRFDAA